MPRNPDRLIAFLFLTLLLPAGLGAQPEAGAEQPNLFFEEVEVTVVNVDAYVTDRQGNRVTDLTMDDFEILEDGRPVEITNFYAVVDRQRVASAPSGTERLETLPPPRTAPTLERAPLPEDQRLYLVLYFDNLFLKPFNRNRVVREVARFVRTHVQPDDQVMLVTFDRSLHVRQPFTSDRAVITEALFGIEKLTGFAVQTASERRQVIERLETANNFNQAEPHVDLYAKSVFHDVTTSIEALKALVSSLAGLPGRKAILHVSDGIPMTAAEDLFFYLDQKYTRGVSGQLLASQYRARRQFRELTAHANANRVTFYTLEAAGLRSHASLSAEHGRTDTSFIEVDSVFVMNRQESLQVMAADTGGLATFNTNNVTGALEELAGDLGSYYSLGYSPPEPGDGRYHKIEVRVKRPGLQVRHRAGYRDKTPETRVTEGVFASLLHGAEKNPLGAELRLEPARPREEGYYLVPLLVRIPLGNVTLIPATEKHQGRLLVSVAVLDEKGRTSTPQHTPLLITIPDVDIERARQQFYVYTVELLMREGQHTVAVGIRDEIAHESAFLRRRVQVGS